MLTLKKRLIRFIQHDSWTQVYTLCLKKHVTTFSMISCLFTKIFGTLTTKSIGHQQVFLVSHIIYLVQLLYLGKLSRPKYPEFSLKMLIFSMLQC